MPQGNVALVQREKYYYKVGMIYHECDAVGSLSLGRWQGLTTKYTRGGPNSWSHYRKGKTMMRLTITLAKRTRWKPSMKTTTKWYKKNNLHFGVDSSVTCWSYAVIFSRYVLVFWIQKTALNRNSSLIQQRFKMNKLGCGHCHLLALCEIILHRWISSIGNL